MYKLTILTVAILFFSCSNDGPIEPALKEIFEIVWTSELKDGEDVIGTDNVQFYQNNFITTGGVDDPLSMKSFDTNNGDVLWDFVSDGIVNDPIDELYKMNNTFIGITSDGIVAINVNTRTITWEIDFVPQNWSRRRGLVFKDGFFYVAIQQHIDFNIWMDHMLKVNTETGVHEIVYTIQPDGEYSPHMSPPAFWKNPDDGSTIMYFSNGWDDVINSPQSHPTDFLAIDIDSKQVLWEAKDFCEVSTNLGYAPVIYGNDILMGGDWSIYSFKLNNGELNWRKEIPDNKPFGIWSTTDHLLVNDRLFINPTGPEIFCIDPGTGEFIWENYEDASNCSDNMVFYNDMLVFTSWGKGSVMVLDANTGERIHKETEFDNSSFNNDTVYDPATDMFFTATYKHAIGFKINKPN